MPHPLLALIASGFLAPTAHAQCTLLEVTPTRKDVVAPFHQFTDTVDTTTLRQVPRGSFVWKTPVQKCNADFWTVQVLSLDPLYQDQREAPPPAPLAFGCMPVAALSPVSGHTVVDATGTRSVLESAGSCVEPGGSIRYEALADYHLLRHTPGMDQVKEAYGRLFGAIPAGEPRATDWGFVALPFAHTLTREEIAKRNAAEHLANANQTGRGVYQIGPGDPPYYVHFLGDDDPDSDIWGRPELIVTLMEMSRNWYDFCVKTAAPTAKISPDAAKSSCTLQFGDLAWYNDRDDDPLGHRSHKTGRCVDIRLFRSDGSWYEANWRKRDDRKGYSRGYSRDLTTFFLAWATNTYELDPVYFNDPKVRKKVKAVEKWKGHDDHIHMCISREMLTASARNP